MPRMSFTRWLTLGIALLVFVAGAGGAPARKRAKPGSKKTTAQSTPVRAAPTRPAQLWPTTRFHGADYVDVHDIASRFGLKAAWTKPGQKIALKNGNDVRFTFELGERDFYFDDLRVFLGERPMFEKDTLWLAKLDVIKIIAPLCRPIDHLAQFPDAPPKLIVLDAGHGGSDPGTENTKVGINEKTSALDVALRLRKLLELRGWRVLMVREKDVELSKNKKTDLQMRDDLANKNNADLFLSIHFNSAPQAISGVETFALAPQFMLSTSDENGDEMTKIAFPGNRFDFANLMFAEQLHRAMRAGLKTPDRGLKRQRWAVLRMLDCPGVMVECAYLSNDAEARRVATPGFRQLIAESLADGIDRYAAKLTLLRREQTEAAARKAGR